jgi:hypothetical protein
MVFTKIELIYQKRKTMSFKFDTEKFLDNLHLFGITILFGVASFLFKVREKQVEFKGINVLTELTFSAVAAYTAFKLGKYFAINEDLISVFTGIAAWSGTLFIKRMELILNAYFTKKFNLDIESVESDK